MCNIYTINNVFHRTWYWNATAPGTAILQATYRWSGEAKPTRIVLYNIEQTTIVPHTYYSVSSHLNDHTLVRALTLALTVCCIHLFRSTYTDKVWLTETLNQKTFSWIPMVRNILVLRMAFLIFCHVSKLPWVLEEKLFYYTGLLCRFTYLSIIFSLLFAIDNLKITDFGFSTVFRHKGKERPLGKCCGTPPYVAPEV